MLGFLPLAFVLHVGVEGPRSCLSRARLAGDRLAPEGGRRMEPAPLYPAGSAD